MLGICRNRDDWRLLRKYGAGDSLCEMFDKYEDVGLKNHNSFIKSNRCYEMVLFPALKAYLVCSQNDHFSKLKCQKAFDKAAIKYEKCKKI